jgi:hypothetical protein
MLAEGRERGTRPAGEDRMKHVEGVEIQALETVL